MTRRRKRLLLLGFVIGAALGAVLLFPHRVHHAVAFAQPVVHEPRGYQKIHVFVALCDRLHQQIGPVSAATGNGQDPEHNLYWGARYGVKTFFTRSPDWKLVKDIRNPKVHVLERLIFRHTTRHAYLVADAYDGLYIQQAISDVVSASSGANPEVISIQGHPFVFGGGAHLLAYVGHNGLLNFSINPQIAGGKKTARKEVLLMCCGSRLNFSPWLEKAGAYPLLWTTCAMCPEAYTLHTAVAGWLRGDSPQSIREQTARCYCQYQKCRLSGARALFLTGY